MLVAGTPLPTDPRTSPLSSVKSRAFSTATHGSSPGSINQAHRNRKIAHSHNLDRDCLSRARTPLSQYCNSRCSFDTTEKTIRALEADALHNDMVRHVLYLAPQAELTRRTVTVGTIRFIDAGDSTAKLDEYKTVNLSSVN